MLAGQALVELRLWEKAVGQKHCEALLKRVRRWLVRLIEGGLLSPRVRAEAGDVLGQLGDPRPGVVTVLIGDWEAPDILWVYVPASPFTMGSVKDEKLDFAGKPPAHTLSLPDFHAHTLTLPDFYIGRFPITNAQYGVFVAAGGYEDETLWTSEGWAWRQGAEIDLSPIDDEQLKKEHADWLKNRPRERRGQPYWCDDPKWGRATRPVVGVTWYEATAFCNWLSSRFAHAEIRLNVWENAQVVACALSWQSFSVRLPSEAEWEKAGRGVAGWPWPWGNDWQEDRANTQRTRLGETSAVGIFPAGASPYGALDMSGNVWEWTQSRWGRHGAHRPDYGYPYRPDDGREDLSGPDFRVVRGGSWVDSEWNARCTVRYMSVPGRFSDLIGFRVVMSLSDSGL